MHWPLTRVAVAERSMEPALRPGDWLLVWRTRRVRAGQIVLARHPGRPELPIVQRGARPGADRGRGGPARPRARRGPPRAQAGGWGREPDTPDAGAVDSRRFGPVPGALIE